jgi:hypothetical protein
MRSSASSVGEAEFLSEDKEVQTNVIFQHFRRETIDAAAHVRQQHKNVIGRRSGQFGFLATPAILSAGNELGLPSTVKT